MDIHGRDISTMDGEDISKQLFIGTKGHTKRFLGEKIIRTPTSWKIRHPKHELEETPPQKQLLGEDIIQKTDSWKRHHSENDFLEKTSSKNGFVGQQINQKLISWISMVHDEAKSWEI